MVPDDQLEQIAGDLEEDLRMRLQQARVDREILRKGFEAAVAALPKPEPEATVVDSAPLLRSIAAIDAAAGQKETLDALVGELAGRVNCCAVIVYRRDKAMAWHGPGFGLEEGEELGSKKTELWPAGDSLVERARAEGRALVSEGELSSGDWNVLEALGAARPQMLAAIPMVIRGKAQAVVLVGGTSVDDPDALALMTSHAAMCVDLQRIRTRNGYIALSPPEHVGAAPAPAEEAVVAKEQIEIEAPTVVEEPAELVVEEESEIAEEPIDLEASAVVDEPGSQPEGPVKFELVEEPSTPKEPEAAAEPEFELVKMEPPPEEETELEIPAQEDVGVEPAKEEERVEAPSEPAAAAVELEGYDLSEFNDEEREAHEKAIRFARLLVSEIKLYNEDAVRLGRENKDLGTRLQDDIERSKSLYNERIPKDVREQRDYLQGELVRQLAKGDESLMG